MGFPSVPLWLVSALRRPSGRVRPGTLRYEPVIARRSLIRTSLRYPDKSATPFRVTPHRPPVKVPFLDHSVSPVPRGRVPRAGHDGHALFAGYVKQRSGTSLSVVFRPFSASAHPHDRTVLHSPLARLPRGARDGVHSRLIVFPVSSTGWPALCTWRSTDLRR